MGILYRVKRKRRNSEINLPYLENLSHNHRRIFRGSIRLGLYRSHLRYLAVGTR